MKFKTYTQSKQPLEKIKARDFAIQLLSKHAFKICRKKGSDFFVIVALYKNEISSPSCSKAGELFPVDKSPFDSFCLFKDIIIC